MEKIQIIRATIDFGAFFNPCHEILFAVIPIFNQLRKLYEKSSLYFWVQFCCVFDRIRSPAKKIGGENTSVKLAP
jgi:hypothetical protein